MAVFKPVVDQDKRHFIGGVRRLGLTGTGVNHLFGVAVIGRDQHRHPGGPGGSDDPAEAVIHRFHRGHRRLNDAGVANHV